MPGCGSGSGSDSGSGSGSVCRKSLVVWLAMDKRSTLQNRPDVSDHSSQRNWCIALEDHGRAQLCICVECGMSVITTKGVRCPIRAPGLGKACCTRTRTQASMVRYGTALRPRERHCVVPVGLRVVLTWYTLVVICNYCAMKSRRV